MSNRNGSGGSTPTDVILIGLESLRTDHFSEEYLPESWDLFEDFAHFEQAYANGVATPLSYQSVLTGYPIESDSKLPENHPTLAECYDGYSFAISNNIHLLASRGYDRGFNSFQQYPREIPSSTAKTIYFKLRGLAGQSDLLTALYNQISDSVGSESAADLSQSENRAAGNLLSVFGDEVVSRHGLFWTHVFDTHSPFYPHKVLDRSVDVEYTDDQMRSIHTRFESGTASEADIDVLLEMYAELIGYVDRQLHSFFDRIREAGKWEDALIVIFGDHGECFGENDVYGHGWDNHPIDPLIRVPLLVKYPNGAYGGERFKHPVQLGDLFATLADYLGWDHDGPPHTRPLTDRETRPVISKSNTSVRVITHTGSAIRSSDGISTSGTVSSSAIDVLQDATIPAADDLSGNIPGLNHQERERVNERLKYLGYKEHNR